MKKRIVALVLAVLTLVLALGFAGCKKNMIRPIGTTSQIRALVIGITYFRPMNYMENGDLSASRPSLPRLFARSSA